MKRFVAGACDIVIFLLSVQLMNSLKVACSMKMEDVVCEKLRDDIITTSIGPIITDAIIERGITPDFVPKHPKLAIRIRQLATAAPGLVATKRHAG